MARSLWMSTRPGRSLAPQAPQSTSSGPWEMVTSKMSPAGRPVPLAACVLQEAPLWAQEQRGHRRWAGRSPGLVAELGPPEALQEARSPCRRWAAVRSMSARWDEVAPRWPVCMPSALRAGKGLSPGAGARGRAACAGPGCLPAQAQVGLRPCGR